ncbi:MAG: hypothetical protein KDA92_17620 [Planctomycetales bacterium]|nr:hypothetical protein [Planctomycetales bacterium]
MAIIMCHSDECDNAALRHYGGAARHIQDSFKSGSCAAALQNLAFPTALKRGVRER